MNVKQNPQPLWHLLRHNLADVLSVKLQAIDISLLIFRWHSEMARGNTVWTFALSDGCICMYQMSWNYSDASQPFFHGCFISRAVSPPLAAAVLGGSQRQKIKGRGKVSQPDRLLAHSEETNNMLVCHCKREHETSALRKWTQGLERSRAYC